VAGTFAAQYPALFLHHFQHVAVAHLGAGETDALLLEQHFQRHVRHQGAHGAGHGARRQAVLDHDVQQLVAVIQAARRVTHDQAVGVAVERDAEIGAMLDDGRGHGSRRRGAEARVDVEAVRLVADGNDFRAQFMEHVRGDMVGGAVGAIDDDLQATQVQLVREGALAKFDVTALGVVEALGAAQLVRRHAGHGRIERRLDFQLHAVGQLGALAGKELDAVVLVGIVRSGNDHAGRQAQRPRQVGNGRRRHGAGQHHVHAGGRQARFQRRFQHVAGNARVLADQYGRMRLAALRLGQHRAGCIAEAHDEIGSDRGGAHQAADAIGTKIFTRHSLSLFVVYIKSYRLSAPCARPSGHRRFPLHHAHG